MIEDRDSWETPTEFWRMLNSQYHFDFDCCANAKNTKTLDYSEDFLKEDEIPRTAWMNPPFSKANEMFNHFFKVVKEGVAIYRCDNMETKVWQEQILPFASWIWIPRGRIAYEGQEGNGARFPSAIIGFNVSKPVFSGGHILNKLGED